MNELSLDSWRWMPELGSASVFIPVCVKEVDSRTRCVAIESEAGDRWTIAAEEVLTWDKVTSASMSLVDDLARSPDGASQRSVVNQLRRRFQKGLPYVWVGDALVFMQQKNVVSQSYVPEDALRYRQQDSEKGVMPVHIYEVIKSAHSDAVHSCCDQSLLILGENGSGKSDMLKLGLGFLEQAEPSRLAGCRLMKASEVLESFGGAHTGQSSDSICFSQRWIIDFRTDGCIVNAKVQACLLEKSRVTFRLPGESNFRVFHCLCAGVDESMRRSLQLPLRPKLLAGGQASAEPNSPEEPAHDLCQLCSNLTDLGFSEDEVGALLRSVSAVLALGELEFETAAAASSERKSPKSPSRTSSGHACVITPEASPALQAFAVLAGCDASAARRALTVCDVGVQRQSSHSELGAGDGEKQRWSPVRRASHVGRGSRDTRKVRPGKAPVEIPLTCMQASQSRDKLCRALYMQIFEYLVSSICEKLAALPGSAWEEVAEVPGSSAGSRDTGISTGACAPSPAPDPSSNTPATSSRGPSRIHLVDFAGFEYSQANSLEQFCTNYVNEWLRAFFQLHLWTEAEICSSKGIKLDNIELEDNSECVKALSHDSGGVLGLLDEATLAQSGSDTSFLEALQCRIRPAASDATSSSTHREPLFRVSLQARVFEVRHYAANITYDVTGWVAMNRDHLTSTMHQLVQGLGNPVFAHCAAVNCTGVTQVSSLRTQLSEVISTLESSHRRYVWCIRPNRRISQDAGPSDKFEDAIVLDQLQTSGILHTIALERMGYPHKLSVSDFIVRYGALIPGAHSAMEVVDAARRVGGFAPDAIAISDGQIAFRDDVLEELENVCQSCQCAAATSIQAAWRRHLVCAERRAYVGSFMSPTAAEPDPGQALQEVEDLLLQLRVCPPPRFFNMAVLERRFLSATETRRELLQNAVANVSAKAVSVSSSAEAPDDGMCQQLHETLRQHVMVAHRFRVPVEPDAEACLQRYKEWEQTQQLDTSLATMLPLLQGGATLQEVQQAVSELAQSSLWQSYGQEAAEEAILEPCLKELGAWADSRVSSLIDEADKVEGDCSPRANDDSYMQVLSNRLQELHGLEHLLSTLRVLPPLKRNAAAEMQRLHAARIRAASRGLDKALEKGGPVELERQLQHTCAVFSEASAQKDQNSESFDVHTHATSPNNQCTMHLVPHETREKVCSGIQSRLSQHSQEITALTSDGPENSGAVGFSMVPEAWMEELSKWIKLAEKVINAWNLMHNGLCKDMQGAQDLLAKYQIWQCQDVEQDCIAALSSETALRSGPEGLEAVLKQCLGIVKGRLGTHLVLDEIDQIMRRSVKCAVVRQMLQVVEKAPLPTSFDAKVTPAELAVFEELLPWWRYALDKGFTQSPEKNSSMLRVSDFTRRCIERLDQSEVDAATTVFCSDIAKADVGSSVEVMLSSRSAALSSKLQANFASSLTPEQCAEKLRPAAANVLAVRVEEAINFMVGHATTSKPATADDAWLNYLGLEVGSGKFTNLNFQAVHELKTWLKQWMAWGGADHNLAQRAEEALETCREWAIVERWMVARESVRPLVEVALEKGLNKMTPDAQKLVSDLVADLFIEESEASSKVGILVLLEGALRTRKLLNEIHLLIDAARDSDGLAVPSGIRHFGQVPRPRIAQLRRAVELLSIHPSELAEKLGPCVAEAQELLADFIRWQPYARWVEALAGLACMAGGNGALMDLCAAGHHAIHECRPAMLPEEEAYIQLQNVLQEALAKRWAALSKYAATGLPRPLDIAFDEDDLSGVAPPFHKDIEELRALHSFFEQDAPKLGLSRPKWFNEASLRLDAVAAWENKLIAKKLLVELLPVIVDKAVAQVLLKVRQTHARLIALGWAADEIGTFISAYTEVCDALAQRITRAYEEMCKWTRPRSARRTPRTPRSGSASASPRRTSPAATPRRTCPSQCRPGLLQGTLQALMDAPSLRWTPALRACAGELDFSAVPASVLRELQSWVQIANLCGLQGVRGSLSLWPVDRHHSRSPVTSCRILLWQRECWQVQFTLRETLMELRLAIVQAALPDREDFRRKCYVATRDIRLALSSFQKTLADFGPMGAVGDCDRVPELATCSLDAHIDCCVAHHILEVVCDEQLPGQLQEFKRMDLPASPAIPASQSLRHLKQIQTLVSPRERLAEVPELKKFHSVISPRERLAEVPEMLRAWLSFAEEQQQVVAGTSLHDVRRRLHFGNGSNGVAVGIPNVLAACREALEREQHREQNGHAMLLSEVDEKAEEETETEVASLVSPSSQQCLSGAAADEGRLTTPADSEGGPTPSPRENAALQAAGLETEPEDVDDTSDGKLLMPTDIVSTPPCEHAVLRAQEFEMESQPLVSETVQAVRQQWQPDLNSIGNHSACDLESFISDIREGFSRQISETLRVMDAQLLTHELDDFDQAILEALVQRVARHTEQLRVSVRKEDPSRSLATLQSSYGLSRELLDLWLSDPSGDRRVVGDVIALPPMSFAEVPSGEADDLRLLLLVTEAEFGRVGTVDAQSNSTISAASNFLQAEHVWQRSCLQHDYCRRLSELVLYHNAGPTVEVVKELAADLEQSLLEIGLGASARSQEMELFDATAAALLLRQVQASLESTPGKRDFPSYFAHIATLHQLVHCLGPGGPWPAASSNGALRRPWSTDGEVASLLSKALEELQQARDVYRKHIHREVTYQLQQCVSSTVNSKAPLELPMHPPRRVLAICPALVNSPLPQLSCQGLWSQVLREIVVEQLRDLLRELELREGSMAQYLELEAICAAATHLSEDPALKDDGDGLHAELLEGLNTAQAFIQRRDAGRRRASWRVAEEHVRSEYAARGAEELRQILQEAEACLEASFGHGQEASHRPRWHAFVSKFICQQLQAFLTRAKKSGHQAQQLHLRPDLQRLLELADELDFCNDTVRESQQLLQLLVAKSDRITASISREEAAAAACLGARSAARLAVGRLARDPPAPPIIEIVNCKDYAVTSPEQQSSALSSKLGVRSPTPAGNTSGRRLPHSSSPRGNSSPRHGPPRSVSPRSPAASPTKGKISPRQRSSPSRQSRPQSARSPSAAHTASRSAGQLRSATTGRPVSARSGNSPALTQSHCAVDRTARLHKGAS